MEQEPSAAPRSTGETPHGLVDTLSNLGQGVTETVEKVTTALTETGESVGGAVRDTVAAVKSAFDPVGLMRRHPWGTFAGCIFAGFLLGKLSRR